jgi:hypothetical protein
MIGWLHGLVELLPGRPNLFQALRRPAARSERQLPAHRLLALVGGVSLLPLAALLAAVEVMARRAGTIYVEARRV